MWRNEFSPEELQQVCDCFDIAWRFVEHSRPDMFPQRKLARELLAIQVFGLAKRGETDKVKIANMALGQLRQLAQRTNSEFRIGERAVPAFAG
jgi:hypothetical protein